MLILTEYQNKKENIMLNENDYKEIIRNALIRKGIIEEKCTPDHIAGLPYNGYARTEGKLERRKEAIENRIKEEEDKIKKIDSELKDLKSEKKELKKKLDEYTEEYNDYKKEAKELYDDIIKLIGRKPGETRKPRHFDAVESDNFVYDGPAIDKAEEKLLNFLDGSNLQNNVYSSQSQTSELSNLLTNYINVRFYENNEGLRVGLFGDDVDSFAYIDEFSSRASNLYTEHIDYPKAISKCEENISKTDTKIKDLNKQKKTSSNIISDLKEVSEKTDEHLDNIE